MAPVAFPGLIMLGPAPGTRGGIASVVETYREHGLFKRWPVHYAARHQAGRFAALLARQRKVILHVHTAPGAAFWVDAFYAAGAMVAGCPVILHLHRDGFERLYDGASLAGRAVISHVIGQAACVAVPAQRMAAGLHSVHAAARVRVLPTPVALPPVREGERPNLILFVGRLRAEKGIFDLLDAVSRLRAAVPDVRLVCAGEGERAAVMRYAERLRIADAVKLIGWVGPSGKRALLESAAAFALPSYAEGMPVSLLEAMAAGVPAVTTPVGGIPDLVTDGGNGFLAAPGDRATLQRALSSLLLDRSLARRIGAAGRQTVKARFSAEHALPQLEALYAELGLAHTGPRASPWPASQAG